MSLYQLGDILIQSNALFYRTEWWYLVIQVATKRNTSPLYFTNQSTAKLSTSCLRTSSDITGSVTQLFHFGDS